MLTVYMLLHGACSALAAFFGRRAKRAQAAWDAARAALDEANVRGHEVVKRCVEPAAGEPGRDQASRDQASRDRDLAMGQLAIEDSARAFERAAGRWTKAERRLYLVKRWRERFAVVRGQRLTYALGWIDAACSVVLADWLVGFEKAKVGACDLLIRLVTSAQTHHW